MWRIIVVDNRICLIGLLEGNSCQDIIQTFADLRSMGIHRMTRNMMTSSNEYIFRVTGPLCGEVTGEFPAQRPVTWIFDIFFYLRLSKRSSRQSWGWWSETPSRPLWRNCNEGSSNCTKILVMLLFGSSPSQPWRKFLDHCGLNADIYPNAQPNYTGRNITKCYETERKLWI